MTAGFQSNHMERIKNQWAEYFEDLLNAATQFPERNGVCSGTCPTNYYEEVKDALKKPKNNKASGVYGIRVELLIAKRIEMSTKLHQFIKTV